MIRSGSPTGPLGAGPRYCQHPITSKPLDHITTLTPDIAGVGGCSNNCFCDSSASGGAVCTDSTQCAQSCNSDADCSTGNFCTDRQDAVDACGSKICESYTDCSSTYSPTQKRGVAALFDRGESVVAERFRHVAAIRARWAEKFPRSTGCTRASVCGSDS
jgi:hypothetical protein